MARRIEVFRPGCPVCVSGEALMRDVAGDNHEVMIRDLPIDEIAAALVAEHGIKAVPPFAVDGRLLGCGNNAGPDRDEQVVAGVGQPPT